GTGRDARFGGHGGHGRRSLDRRRGLHRRRRRRGLGLSGGLGRGGRCLLLGRGLARSARAHHGDAFGDRRFVVGSRRLASTLGAHLAGIHALAFQVLLDRIGALLTQRLVLVGVARRIGVGDDLHLHLGVAT